MNSGRAPRVRASTVHPTMADTDHPVRLYPGMPVVYGGSRVTYVDPALAEAFEPGDRLVVVQSTGDLLHVPADQNRIARDAVTAAVEAFARMSTVDDQQIDAFYAAFAAHLADDDVFAPIERANRQDVERARRRGRSTTRLVLSERMRSGMVEGLEAWRQAPGRRGRVTGRIDHDGWTLEEVVTGLGVVGFVFEGRPNVFADATGVLRGGNTVVFRIGSDALATARAIMRHALEPALEEAGLPAGAASLVDSPTHAAGWAMFSDPRLGLAVARGSGPAVAQLGAVARQAGNAVSLHGTGGAWIVATRHADAKMFAGAVEHSLDRKVCNTLNTCCIVADAADDLVPVFLDAVQKAAASRGVEAKLHVLEDSTGWVPDEWFRRRVPISRADGEHRESRAETIAADALGHEWEWEQSPEVTLAVVDDLDQAIRWFNQHSPRFIASLVSERDDEQDHFFARVDAPFVGDGFTRWVDGQYALDKPELGLSNWEHGRLLGRSGILSGDSAFTVRLRASQQDPDVHR